MNAGKLARKRRHLSRSIALMFVGHVGSVQQNQRAPPIRWPNLQSEGATRLPEMGRTVAGPQRDSRSSR